MSSVYLPKDALRLAMLVAGVDKNSLSEKAKVPINKIDLILNGMNSQPSSEVLSHLSKYLGVSIDALAGNEEIIGAEQFIFSEQPKDISGVLKHLMLLTRETESSLSKKTNVSQPILHRLINEESSEASFKTLSKLAGFFSLTIDQLTGRSDLNYSKLETNCYKKVPVIGIDLVPHFKELLKSVSRFTEYVYVANAESTDFCVTVESSIYEPQFYLEDKLIFSCEYEAIIDQDVFIIGLFEKGGCEVVLVEYGEEDRFSRISQNNLNEEIEWPSQSIVIFGRLYKTISST